MVGELFYALHSSSKKLRNIARGAFGPKSDESVFHPIHDLLIEEERENMEKNFFKVGEKYFIRTATNYIVGECVTSALTYIVMSKASWIPITGRFHQVFIKGEFEEVEPFKNDVFVNVLGIIDATIWDHDLPREAK